MSFQNWQLQPDILFAQGPVVPVIVIKDLATAVPLATFSATALAASVAKP